MKKNMFFISAIALGIMSASASAMVVDKTASVQEKYIGYDFYAVAVPADNAKNIKYTDLQNISSNKDMSDYLLKIEKNEGANLITNGSGLQVNNKNVAFNIGREIPYIKSVSTKVSNQGLTKEINLENSVFKEGLSLVIHSKEDNGFIRSTMHLNNSTLLDLKKGNVEAGEADLLDIHSTKIDESFIVKPNQVVKYDTSVYLRNGKEYKDIYFIKMNMGTLSVKNNES